MFIVGEHKDFKFGVQVDHSKSQPTDNKPYNNCPWKGRGHITWPTL